MPYCPNCGAQVEEEYDVCPICGERLKGPERRVGGDRPRAGAMDHLSKGFNIAMAKPLVFAPIVLGGVISIVIEGMWGDPFDPMSPSPLLLFPALMSLIGAIVTFLLNFASIDMLRDAYLNEPLDLMQSINYVVGRIGTLFVAAIVGALLSITIILTPVAIFMFVIIVMDETGIGDAVSKAFSVLRVELGDILLLLIISLVGFAVLSWVPVVGGLLNAFFGVVVDIAFIDVYYLTKN